MELLQHQMADTKLTKLGGSLKVANVQQLAKENLAKVPPRYVRPDQRDIVLSCELSSLPQFPIVDMQKLLDGHSMESELQALHNACKDWGFFTLINHGVDSTVIENMKVETRKFFNLPLEEKEKFGQEPDDVEGYGQVFVQSEEQKLDWADVLYLLTSPNYLRKAHLLPKFPATFRDAIEAYSRELGVLGMKILEMMAKALGIKAEDMKTLFEGGMQSMRTNYYPPCPEPELVTGLCPHSDPNGLTIVLQFDEVEGLQIVKDGLWFPVSPLPNSFVINVGDILEMVTNGAYRSVLHRVVVNAERERISIGTFLSSRLDGDVGPAPSLVSPQNPPKYKTINGAEYFKGLLSKELNSKTYIDTMRL